MQSQQSKLAELASSACGCWGRNWNHFSTWNCYTFR